MAMWKSRNKMVFGRKSFELDEMLESVKISLWNWLKVQILGIE